MGGGAQYAERSKLAHQPHGVHDAVVDAGDALLASLRSAYRKLFVDPKRGSKRFGKASILARAIGAAPEAGIMPLIGLCEALTLTLQGVRNELSPMCREELLDKYK